MRKVSYFIVLFLGIFVSCEKIDGDERFIESGSKIGNKMILVEDFTGQKCVNCPSAATFLSDLNEALDNHLIVVSMHAGGFALKTPLYNETAQTYMSSLNLSSNPAISIDRVYNSDQQYQDWAQPLTERVSLNSVCNINTELIYDEEGKNVTAMSNISFIEDFAGKVGVQYYVLRDSIVDFQQSNTGFILQYVHNHVFSGTMYSDIWGQELPGKTDGKYVKDIVYKSPETSIFDLKDWDPAKVSIVSFVFKYTDDNEIGEVLQANKVKLLN